MKKSKWLIGGGLVLGMTLLGGARYMMRERQTPEPDFLEVEREGDFAIRDYLPMWVAETISFGTRREAIRSGFRTLADYIFARSHDGDSIPMTAPVIEEADGEDRWRVRFVMPEGEDEDSLPEPPHGVHLKHLPARRVATVRFDGRPGDYDLVGEVERLRQWLEARGETILSTSPEYAFFNSPSMPGPLRRNEVWLEIATPLPAAS
ncbi:SOUL family heme-binding protein [Sphingomicrobium flavum]|uniref:SOUL family heme-binding protein n=1 Tax=Sphingomicrobium flavum TaxID=1229164 RepID=UPI0021ADC347|nr:heme-binding protein [Sphingomicrobium flavum]